MIEISFTVEDKVCVIMRNGAIYGVKDGKYDFYEADDLSDSDVSLVLMMQNDAEQKCKELGDDCSYRYIVGTATVKGWAPYNSCTKAKDELIDADNVMNALYNTSIELYNSEYEEFQREIDKIPTIDLESLRPTAHWEPCDLVEVDTSSGECYRNKNMGVKCSSCHHAYNKYALWDRSFCPGCGARMVNTDE